MDGVPQPPAYSYTQLPPGRWVRLLQITPNASCQHGFSLRLTTHSLSDVPPFWALSYTWGSPDFPEDDKEDAEEEEKTFQVRCDRQVVEVGESLFDFLRQMSEDISKPQANSRSTTPVSSRVVVPDRRTYFWIDAICINQQDINERSEQVQLMGDLYQCASKVIAWLGKTQPNDNVRWVLDTFAPLVGSLVRSRRGASQIFRAAGYQLDHPDAVDLLGEDFCWRWRFSYLDYFAFFARKRWLTRGWVVQEAAIPAPEDVVLLCGNCQFSWSVINKLSGMFLMVAWDHPLNAHLDASLPAWKKRPGTLDRLWNPVSISLPDFQKEKVCESMVDWQNTRWGTVTDEEVRYAEVLHTFHRLRIYDFGNPLDRIYGALGLIHRILGPNNELGIIPSYDIPVDQAFTEVAEWLIQHLPNLDMLGLAGLAEGRRESLPSWVPDFTFRGPLHYTSLQRARQLSMYSRWFRRLDATRTKDGSSKPFVQIRGSDLVLQGICIDKIKKCQSLQFDKQGVLGDVSWILDFCGRHGVYGLRNETFAEVVVKTLSADGSPERLNHREYTERCERWVRDCITYNWLYNRGDAVSDISSRLETSSIESDDARAPFMTVSDALQAASQDGFGSRLVDDNVTKNIHFISCGRHILETDQGYLGLGPAETRPGDEVWLLKGGRMPLLLRKAVSTDCSDDVSAEADKEGYVLVGEAYLHGIMYGEGMSNELRGKFRQVVIV